MVWSIKVAQIEKAFSTVEFKPVVIDGYIKVNDPKRTYELHINSLKSDTSGDTVKIAALHHLRKLHKALLKVSTVKFNGSDYDPELDNARLTGQIERVFNCMKDGKWRTLSEINETTGDPPASISAQLRHLRKERFGNHSIEKRRRGNPSDGLFEYKLVVNKLANVG